MKRKTPKPKAIWVVSPTLGKTRFPVCSASTSIDWNNATPTPAKTKFSRFTTDCTRCRGCEIICSFYREKVINPRFSRIRISTNEIEWIEGKTEKIV